MNGTRTYTSTANYAQVSQRVRKIALRNKTDNTDQIPTGPGQHGTYFYISVECASGTCANAPAHRKSFLTPSQQRCQSTTPPRPSLTSLFLPQNGKMSRSFSTKQMLLSARTEVGSLALRGARCLLLIKGGLGTLLRLRCRRLRFSLQLERKSWKKWLVSF
jgi:hypothetical protein